MKRIVDHEVYGKVILDTDTQTYEYIDHSDFTFIDAERYFKDAISFDNSSSTIGYIPVVCTAVKQIKKRTLATFLEWNNRILSFYNVEMIEAFWTHNAIEGVAINKCYVILLQKNNLAVNEYILLKYKEVRKG